MRAFIAIDIPEDAKSYLRALQGHIQFGKFSIAGDFHITLKFLGEISEQGKGNAIASLQQIKFEKFTASLSQFGFFPKNNPNSKNPRVIWIGAGPLDKFTALHTQVEISLMNQFGKHDYEKFVPHITLARVKEITSHENFMQSISSAKLKSIEFPVDRITLKKSTLTPEGPAYEDLEEFLLQ